MGCDIHLHTEFKVAGKWYHWGTPDVRRDYALFARMANVRNYDSFGIDPISEPRGLPDGISFTTAFDARYQEGDAHSHSYLTAKEIVVLSDWYKEHIKESFAFCSTFGFFLGDGFPAFTKYPEDRPRGVEDVRFVFWFDN